ncbi:putative DNA-binding protein [Archaeoglobus fulgidus DSM 8774]|uniref:Putative DNA-binding protein n=1 Tax=Archaeoglobus fulgidus DSM 8774 TaxID=1344584 RepID=A0A075WEN5_ARCFL|nr:DUF134 domain-containing protein [Archaeoglobus fulgidus]AIG97544.1 putative DNA-binding protein [Archaeoglobus fulgidus DSM 8774]
MCSAGERGSAGGRKLRDIYISGLPAVRAMIPEPGTGKKPVAINLAEAEALRLVDYEEMSFDDAAAKMGVSKATVWRLVNAARKKMAKAVFEGRAILITKGGELERL